MILGLHAVEEGGINQTTELSSYTHISLVGPMNCVLKEATHGQHMGGVCGCLGPSVVL